MQLNERESMSIFSGYSWVDLELNSFIVNTWIFQVVKKWIDWCWQLAGRVGVADRGDHHPRCDQPYPPIQTSRTQTRTWRSAWRSVPHGSTFVIHLLYGFGRSNIRLTHFSVLQKNSDISDLCGLRNLSDIYEIRYIQGNFYCLVMRGPEILSYIRLSDITESDIRVLL